MEQHKTARYDRSTNKVKLTVSVEGKILDGDQEVGYTKDIHDQTFQPEYIKRVWNKLNADRDHIEKELKKASEPYKSKHAIEELDKLREMLQELTKLDEHNKKQATHEHMNKNLKIIKEDIRVFTPIIKQLPKK